MISHTYSEQPSSSTYSGRCAEFRSLTCAEQACDPYTELIRLVENEPLNAEALDLACERIDTRKDCADFRLHGILAILYRSSDRRPESSIASIGRLDDGVRARLEKTVLDFKYWPDEPGIDSMCTWTENHQIMFAAAAYLAGQLFPDRVFTNSGRTGRQQMNRFRPRIERWMDLRFRSGFSEWLSHVYYNEDLPPLLNLIEFTDDPKLVRDASMVVDLLLLDIALNQYRGTFGSTHGRSYEAGKKTGSVESTGPVVWLICGMNQPKVGNMSATLLSTALRYRVPSVIARIAADIDRPEFESRQRMGIRIDEAERWGLGFKSMDDGMVFLSLEAYLHERTAALTLRMFDEWNWWQNDFFAPFAAHRRLIGFLRATGLLRPIVRWKARDLTRNTREEVNLVTYRTPDAMLSCAQDYRAGYGGDQQHVWQATLGPEAVVFTTHPGSRGREGATPNYWTGSGTLPRAAQYRNVVICHYRIDTARGLYHTNRELYTHAWFPKDAFDEVLEAGGWVFARRGDGYVALWSQKPYRWERDTGAAAAGGAAPNEIVVDGVSNIWVCVIGRAAVDDSFESFVDALTRAPLSVTGRGTGEQVSFDAPRHGTIRFGWSAPLSVRDKSVPLSDYRRYDNPYVTADFPSTVVKVRCGDQTLSLNWRDRTRSGSGFVAAE